MAKRSSGPSIAERAGIGMPTVLAVAVVLLLAVAVIGGVALSGSDGGDRADSGTASAVEPGEPIPVTPRPAAYPTTVRGDGVVVAGNPAPRVLDIWEDPLCPGCQQFDQRAADPIASAITEGRLQVRYHLVNLLDESSLPPGYSGAAGNAMICAAGAGAFPTVHASLYAAQPGERTAGYTTEQLVDLGQRAGAGPGYAECVTSGRHLPQITANYERATADPALRGDRGSFGTPTLVLDGRLQSGGDSAELDTLLGG